MEHSTSKRVKRSTLTTWDQCKEEHVVFRPARRTRTTSGIPLDMRHPKQGSKFQIQLNTSNVYSEVHNEKLFTQDTYDFLALMVATIGIFGLCSNSLVLILYCRFKTLRTPTNLLLVNVSFSDLVFSLFGVSFTFASCVSQRWIWNKAGCVFVGMCENLLGCVSIFTLTAVAYERYVRVVFDRVIDYSWSWKAITSVWLCSMAWTMAPLMEWNRYILEPHGLDCSLDRVSTEARHSSFILLSFIACFVVPMSIMIYCYGYILCSVRMLRKLQSVETSQVLRLLHYEKQMAVMYLLMISAFLLCGMPYPVLSLLAMCGHSDMITPATAIVPCFLVKTGAATHATIYILTNKKVNEIQTRPHEAPLDEMFEKP
ncbi:PREDICTED: opsin-3-like [Nanorana parkeri]|uniref:opsin-3-like n=1 Tax=Nanorana parkeri TaxID=125878 RepID=UPI0008544E31|nr:PREDICTED: opsin-3-like [Nanorana parkeri]